jgi:hypothetical protein
MHKVQRMAPEMGPPKCLTCGRGNTPDDGDTLDDFWVMDLERDVNWGDPAYICKYCCEKIAQEAGHAPIEALLEKDEVIKQQRSEIHRVETERDSIRRRFRAATTGKKALASGKRQAARS